MLDVKCRVLLPQDAAVGGGIDSYQWAAILRSVSALVSYQWVSHQNLRPWLVADLLILRAEMPRSLAACYAALSRISTISLIAMGPSEHRGSRPLSHARLTNRNIEDIFQAEGTNSCGILGENNRLGQAISSQYLC